MSAPPTISPQSPDEPIGVEPASDSAADPRPDDSAPVVIDAHHHVWDVEATEHAWLEPLPAINRTFTVDDLHAAAAEVGVTGSVLVQVLASLDESFDFLALAAADPMVRGVVAWVDLTAPGVAETLDRLRSAPGGDHLVGLRHLVHDEPNDRWLLQEQVREGIAAVGAAGLVYDLLLKPWHLPVAAELVASQPDTRFVLDHVAKPDIAHWDPTAADAAAWADGIRALAAHPNVACKVSGMLTEAGPDATSAQLAPYVKTVVDAFGPDRLMLGSDWPVSLLAADYAATWSLLTEALTAAGVSRSDLWHIAGATAQAWYRLPSLVGQSGLD